MASSTSKRNKVLIPYDYVRENETFYLGTPQSFNNSQLHVGTKLQKREGKAYKRLGPGFSISPNALCVVHRDIEKEAMAAVRAAVHLETQEEGVG